MSAKFASHFYPVPVGVSPHSVIAAVARDMAAGKDLTAPRHFVRPGRRAFQHKLMLAKLAYKGNNNYLLELTLQEKAAYSSLALALTPRRRLTVSPWRPLTRGSSLPSLLLLCTVNEEWLSQQYMGVLRSFWL